MAHIIPFTIGDYEFTHTDEDLPLDREARNDCADIAHKAAFTWRREAWQPCAINEGNIPFAVSRVGNPEFIATWMLYRIRPIDTDPDVVSCLAAPTFPDITAVRLPGQPFDEEVEADSEAFWTRTFLFMEWMLDNPMPMATGDDFVVDHWRFPSEDDGDPKQHEWGADSKKFFDLYCTKVTIFDDAGNGRAVKMLATDKPGV